MNESDKVTIDDFEKYAYGIIGELFITLGGKDINAVYYALQYTITSMIVGQCKNELELGLRNLDLFIEDFNRLRKQMTGEKPE